MARFVVSLMLSAMFVATGCDDGVRSSLPPPQSDSGTPPSPLPPPPPPPETCTVDIVGDSVVDSCAAPDICIATRQACEPAGGRRYAILVAFVELPERTLSTAECWDEACGAPDPFVVVEVDGVVVATTAAAQDSFSVTYEPLARADAVLGLGSTIRMVAYDDDVAFDDPAFECSTVVTIDVLRSRVTSCLDPTGFGIGSAVVAVEDAI